MNAANPIRMILNDREVTTTDPPGSVVLDFIRRTQRLMGTKIGCREGDCGACTILVGDLVNGKIRYRTMTSCLMPLANAAGKHIVTIEGLNRSQLTPIQQAIVEEGGSQCGFCTVGFVVSLSGWCMSQKAPTLEEARAAMDGNICRCTGYKSLERAAERIVTDLCNRPDGESLPWLVAEGFLPDYFRDIPERLARLQVPEPPSEGAVMVGGGTDLFVQKPEQMREQPVRVTLDRPELTGIQRKGNRFVFGAATTVEDLKRHPDVTAVFPKMAEFLTLVSSTPIRNMATLGGNLVNASPIGDMTILLLALNTELTLCKGDAVRTLPLKSFYQGYKQLALAPGEWVKELSFEVPAVPHLAFNFEKVSKRTWLDIASVNSAASFSLASGVIRSAGLSAGGVAPIPLFLERTSAWLAGKPIEVATALSAADMAVTEVKPISDARGTAEYKRLLLRQLVRAHFMECFPELSVSALVGTSEGQGRGL